MGGGDGGGDGYGVVVIVVDSVVVYPERRSKEAKEAVQVINDLGVVLIPLQNSVNRSSSPTFPKASSACDRPILR